MLGTRAEIHLEALSENFKNMRAFLPQDVKIASVVKANAYGHDLKTVANHLVTCGTDYLAVATLREALVIRKSQKLIPILVMGYTPLEEFKSAVEASVTLTIFDLESAKLLNQLAEERKVIQKIHVKIDTGFNRLGYKDMAKAQLEIMRMNTYPAIEIEGLFTHLALRSQASDEKQMALFEDLVKSLSEKGVEIPYIHALDSIGSIVYTETPYNLVRLGASLYGYCSRPVPFELKPVMILKTNVSRVAALKVGESISYDSQFVAESPMIVATLPIGYADGFPRQLSSGGAVLINGQRAPILGVMCMDQCMVDVTHIESVKTGSEVILFGTKEMPLTEVARWAKTNRNECLSRISSRVIRDIINQGKVIDTIDYLLD